MTVGASCFFSLLPDHSFVLILKSHRGPDFLYKKKMQDKEDESFWVGGWPALYPLIFM